MKKLKKFVAIFMVALTIITLVPLVANAAGSSMSTATNISLGSSYSGSISSSNTQDFYKFTLSSSGTVKLNLNANIEYLSFYIYDSNGNEVWSSYAYYWNSTAQKMTLIQNLSITSGTYFFAIKAYGSNYGSYNFSTVFTSSNESYKETTQGSNNSIATASSISLGNKIYGQIADNDDRDIYKFLLNDSGRVNINFTAPIEYVSFYIYDINGNTIWESYAAYWNNTAEKLTMIQNFDLTSGTYYLAIVRYGNHNKRVGDYNFSTSYTKANESFSESNGGTNNTMNSANSISINTQYIGQIARNDEKDFYKFNISSTGKQKVKLEASIEHLTFNIYDSNGNEIWGSYAYYWNSTSQKLQLDKDIDFTKTGTYYFAVVRYGNNELRTGIYTFSIGNNSSVPSSYSLSYNANGGSGAPSGHSGAKSYTIKSTVPTRFGYTFLGWSTNSSATSASYTPGSTISLSSNTTLYAVWKSAQSVSAGNSNTVNIAFAEQAWYYKFTPSSSGEYTFESTGSIDSKVTIYKADGTEIGSDDDSGESSNFKKTLSLTSGTTYYIKAFAYSSKTGTYSFKVTKNTPASYTVNFNANGGSVSPTSVIVTAGNSVTLPTPTKKYTLSYNANNGSGAPSSQSVSVSCKGWSTSNTASSASYSCGSSYKPTTNITLYAVWYSNGSATISSTKPTRSGYTFLGWSTSSSASSASYSSGSSISISSNTTLYAVWKKNPTTSYTVNYNANGGSVSPSSATVTAGNSVTLPTPSKTATITYNANGGSGAPSSQNVSLSCSGWSTSSTASSASYSCGSSYKPTANTTLYAVWGKGTTTLSSTKPTRAGYTFLGWANDKNATSAEFQSGTKVSLKGNVTIYAIWKADTSTPVPDDVLTVRTKSLRLDLEEVVNGRSTITMKRTNLGNCKLVVSCSTPEALNLEFTESIYEDSVTLNVETNGVKGEFIVYVRLYNSSKTVLYQEEQIKVVVKDTPYDTIYLNYKDTYSVNNGSDYATYESEDSSIASVDSNGKIKANNTGSTIIYAMDEVDANLRMYKVEVDYNFFQWLILIFLFGWIWY